jgi:hypothetical protein
MRFIVQQHWPKPPTLGLPCLNCRTSRFTLMTDTEHQCHLSGIEPAIQCDVAGTPLRPQPHWHLNRLLKNSIYDAR